MPRRDHRHALRSAAIGIVVMTGLTGCITGERPTLIERPSVDDPAAQAVLDRLGTTAGAEFTATYEITPTLTGRPTTATVVQSGTMRRVSIGDVDFISDGTVTRTCTNDDRGCVDYLDDARISDLNVTHRFWGDAFAARLELDASRRIGFSRGFDETIAGFPAACVDLQVPSTSQLSGTIQYCALDAGPLARYIGADVAIELVEFAETVAPDALDAPDD